MTSCIWPGWSDSFKGVKYLSVHAGEILGLGALPCKRIFGVALSHFNFFEGTMAPHAPNRSAQPGQLKPPPGEGQKWSSLCRPICLTTSCPMFWQLCSEGFLSALEFKQTKRHCRSCARPHWFCLLLFRSSASSHNIPK